MKKIRNLRFLVLALLCSMSYNSHSQMAMFQDKIIAPLADRDPGDNFGLAGSVSIHGNFAVVGTPEEAEYGAGSGAAYLYEYDPVTCDWLYRDKILPRNLDGTINANPGDQFGTSVAIHGNIIAIGAQSDENNGEDGLGAEVECGLVYIYEIVASTANIIQHVHAINNTGLEDNVLGDEFGCSVHLSATHLIVGDMLDDTDEDGVPTGMMRTGAAFIYKWDGAEYIFENKIVSDAPISDDGFGVSVSISSIHAAVGAWQGGLTGVGEVEIFSLGGGSWNHNITFDANVVDPPSDAWDWFGVQLEMDQMHLVVGAAFDEHDETGGGVLMTNAGSAYIFELDPSDGTWSFDQKIVASDRTPGDIFGQDVTISGSRIVVGAAWAPVGGRAYVFEEDGFGVWNEVDDISPVDGAPGDSFGDGVDLFGDNLIVSAPNEDHNDTPPYVLGTVAEAGSAYLFEFNEVADTPVIEAVGGLCVEGATIMLSIAEGDLNDADYWEWYEGDCDTAPIGEGESIEVVLEPGTTYCARGLGDCDWFEEGDCGCITLTLEDDIWHKQTINGVRDQGTDVITDASGCVYMVGEYYTTTEFEGGDVANEVVSSGAADRKSYIVKYDNCGNLVWVANSIDVNPTDDDHAVSLVLDEVSGFVYVLGNYRRRIEFQSGVGGGDIDATPTLTLTGAGPYSRAYIARFDMDDGDINQLYDVTLDPTTNTVASDLAINEATGDIFIGGNYSGVGGNMLFVRRYLLGTIADWTILGFAFNDESVRGLDFDEGSNRLWLLGDFKDSFSLLSSPLMTASNKDAFVAQINPGAPTLVGIRYGNMTGTMEGGGLAVDEGSGNVYFTGNYLGLTTDAFGSSQTMGYIYSGGEHVYFFGLSPAMAAVWTTPHNGAALGGYVKGTDVTIADGRATFVGSFTKGDADLTFGSGIDYFVSGSPANKPHVFAVAYDAVTGAMNWENGTADNTDNDGEHIPTAIDADPFGNAFVSGGFAQRMDYLSGIPASDFLETTAQLASFTMRVESGAAGAFQLPVTVEDEEQIEAERLENDALSLSLKVYPNPIDHDVIIEVGNFDSDQIGEISVLNLDGKVILNQVMESAKTPIDFSNLDAGVYFVRITNGDQIAVQRVVKS